MPVKMPKGKQKNIGTKNGSPKSQKQEPEKDTIEEAVLSELEPVVSFEWHHAVAFGIFLSIYIKCTAASIPSGDAGDFIISSYHFGVAHPPGYPLYVTVGHLWMKFLPFGNPAYKLNLLTAIIGGIAAFIVYTTTFKLTNYIPSAVFSSGVFGFSHLIWFHSVGAEIFSLNNAFCGVLLYWVVRFNHAPVEHRARVALEASFISGLSMCNQHTSALFIAVIGAWMFLSLLKDKAISVQQFIQTGAAFGVALVSYVQLPISAYWSKSPSTWGDHRTMGGIWKHITREEYGTWRLTADSRPGDLVGNLGTYLQDLVHELGVPSLILLVTCLLSAWKLPKIRTVVYVYLVTVLGYVLFFCNQANIDHSRALMKGVLERFWMQSNIVVSVLAGTGLWCIQQLAADSSESVKRFIKGVLLLAAVLATGHQIRQNYRTCDLSNNLIMHDYGRKLLDAAPKNAVLMVEGDMPSLTTRYLRYCENYRPDVDVVDQELIGFPWFKPMHQHIFKHYIIPYDREMYYKDVLARKGDNYAFSYNFKNVFDVHLQAGIPLYIYPFMKHSDEEWKKFYDLVPVSSLYEVRSKSNAYKLSNYIDIVENRDYNFHPNMDYCDAALYPERSWEYVIAESCGHTAFFAAEHAHRLITANSDHTKPESRATMHRILKMYKRATDTLTESLPDGSTRHLHGVDHNKNYGVMAYLLYTSYMNFQPRDEELASKYARIMHQEWDTFFSRAGRPDTDGLKRVMLDATSRFKNLLTDEKYLL